MYVICILLGNDRQERQIESIRTTRSSWIFHRYSRKLVTSTTSTSSVYFETMFTRSSSQTPLTALATTISWFPQKSCHEAVYLLNLLALDYLPFLVSFLPLFFPSSTHPQYVQRTNFIKLHIIEPYEIIYALQLYDRHFQ